MVRLPASSTSAPSDTKTSSESKPAGDDFCGQLEANGADATTFGELQAFLPKESLAKEVDSALSEMGDVTPPQEIAAAWKTRKQYLTELKAAVAKLPAGGRLTDPDLVSNPSASKASKTLTDYWFDTCQ